MRKLTIQSIIVILCLLVSNTSIFGFGGGSTMPKSESIEPVITEKMQALTIPIRMVGSDEIKEVPLFSEKYAQTPVAMVNEEAITLKEFTFELATMHSGMDDSKAQKSQSYTKMLDRLIAIKLIKQEALNIGLNVANEAFLRQGLEPIPAVETTGPLERYREINRALDRSIERLSDLTEEPWTRAVLRDVRASLTEASEIQGRIVDRMLEIR